MLLNRKYENIPVALQKCYLSAPLQYEIENVTYGGSHLWTMKKDSSKKITEKYSPLKEVPIKNSPLEEAPMRLGPALKIDSQKW